MRPEPIYVWPWNFGDMTKHKMKEGARFSCKVFGLSRSRHLVCIYICVYIYICTLSMTIYDVMRNGRSIGVDFRPATCDGLFIFQYQSVAKSIRQLCLGDVPIWGRQCFTYSSDLVDIACGYWPLKEDDVWSYFILFVCLIYPGMQADRGM